MTLLEDLEPKLASFLQRRRFRLLEERRDNAFGNAMVVVDCEGFLLRVVRDRGHTTVEFSAHGDNQWHSGENVLEFVEGSAICDFVDALETHFDGVADLMKSNLTQRGYTAFEKKKADLNIQRIFPQRPT